MYKEKSLNDFYIHIALLVICFDWIQYKINESLFSQLLPTYSGRHYL